MLESQADRMIQVLDRMAVAMERLADNNEQRVEMLREANEQQRVSIELHRHELELSEATIPAIESHRATIGEMVSALRGELATEHDQDDRVALFGEDG